MQFFCAFNRLCLTVLYFPFAGLFVIPGGVIGHFLGGLIVDRLEMTNKNKLKFSLVTSVVSVALFLLIFFVECETTKFAGINEDYDG